MFLLKSLYQRGSYFQMDHRLYLIVDHTLISVQCYEDLKTPRISKIPLDDSIINEKNFFLNINIDEVLGRIKQNEKENFFGIQGLYDLRNLGLYYFSNGQLSLSEKYFRKACDIVSKTTYYEPLSICGTMIFSNLGVVLAAKNNLEEAKKIFNFCYMISLKAEQGNLSQTTKSTESAIYKLVRAIHELNLSTLLNKQADSIKEEINTMLLNNILEDSCSRLQPHKKLII